MLQAAVLGFTQFTPPGAGILQERDKIGDTDDIYACRPEIRIGCQGRQYHKSAVAAPHHSYAARVGNTTFTQVEYRVPQVRYRVHAQAHIIQALVLVAVTGTAAHIGDEHSIATRDKVLNNCVEDRTGLTFWSSMHVNDHRQTTRLLIAGEIQECRYLASIKGWIVYERGCREGVTRNAAECATCCSPEGTFLYIPYPYIRSIISNIERECQATTITRPGGFPYYSSG